MSSTTSPSFAEAPYYDVVVVGGGPAGATAAERLALIGRRVLLLDRAGRVKPCGGAVPPRALRDYRIPDHLLKAKISAARIFAPSGKAVDMPVENGFVGMVDRDEFDEWLRARAARAGAVRATGAFEAIERDADGGAVVRYRRKGAETRVHIRARTVIGADGARSLVGRHEGIGGDKLPHVIAYHEIIRAPKAAPAPAPNGSAYDGARCDVVYSGAISPDFYGWVFPHGETVSVGMGTAHRGVSLRGATAALREAAGLAECETLREEGAPIPLKPLKRWDNGRDVVLAGDAAGVVAPASGEGIYYAMLGGELAADSVESLLATGDARALRTARRRFMKDHGRVFFALGLLQRFFYCSDGRRERFVKMCEDADVQRLTWDAYMNKRMVTRERKAHVRVFLKDVAHLMGWAKT